MIYEQKIHEQMIHEQTIHEQTTREPASTKNSQGTPKVFPAKTLQRSSQRFGFIWKNLYHNSRGLIMNALNKKLK